MNAYGLPREMMCDCGAAPRGCCGNCCRGCSTDTPGASKSQECHDAAEPPPASAADAGPEEAP